MPDTSRKPSDPTAIIALCISIVTAVFSFYQWWYAEDETKMKAAIEISRNYFDTIHQKPVRAILAAALNKVTDETEAEAAMQETNYLEYIAFLANKNKINVDYLSDDIQCDMKFAQQGVLNLDKKFPYMQNGTGFPEIDKFLSNGVRCPPISVNPNGH